jgi:hypothetical protein
MDNIPKNKILTRNTIEQREHEDDAAARRVLPVDPQGNPITPDNRFPVDIGANVTIEGDIVVNLDAIDDLTDPDNVMSVGTEDGTKAGARHVQKIDSDKRLHVRDELARILLEAIEARLGSIQAQTDNLETLAGATNTILSTTIADLLNDIKTNTQDVEGLISNTNTILSVTIADVLSDILNAVNSLPQDNNGLVIGTENGQVGGVQHVFVNNLRQMILAAKDRDQEIIYADFGTKDQRIIRIDYTAPSIGVGAGFTARKTLTYTPVSGRYRRDKITWSLV